MPMDAIRGVKYVLERRDMSFGLFKTKYVWDDEF